MKKSKTRLFIEKRISSNLLIYIKDKQHHFLKNVLRIKLNDKITIFDGTTGEWDSSVISISKDKTGIKILKKVREFESQPDIWLIFAPIKLFRMNITIQKAVELGVSKFIPCKNVTIRVADMAWCNSYTRLFLRKKNRNYSKNQIVTIKTFCYSKMLNLKL